MDFQGKKQVLEAALLCAGAPVSSEDLALMFAESSEPVTVSEVAELLLELAADWEGRGLELVRVAGGWRFQSRASVKPYLSRLKRERPARYSRATMETLAVIAYHQPATRGDIERIRGVAVNTAAVRALLERGWIEVIGHREIPGRPELFATTDTFLSDLGLSSIGDLPELSETGPEAAAGVEMLLGAAGLGLPDVTE